MDPKERIKEFIEYIYGIDLLDMFEDINTEQNIEYINGEKELQES